MPDFKMLLMNRSYLPSPPTLLRPQSKRSARRPRRAAGLNAGERYEEPRKLHTIEAAATEGPVALQKWVISVQDFFLFPAASFLSPSLLPDWSLF